MPACRGREIFNNGALGKGRDDKDVPDGPSHDLFLELSQTGIK